MNIDPPLVLNLDVTYRCNLECKICDTWKITNNQSELTAAEFINIFHDHKDLYGVNRVRILGGEPFVRNDLEEIISNISKYAITEVVTNGTLIDRERAIKVVTSGLQQLRFSIDGPENVHDTIRGKGSFNQAVKAIDLINKLKVQQKSKYPLLRIHPCISKANEKYLDWFLSFAKSKGAAFGMHFLEDQQEAQKKTTFQNRNLINFKLIDHSAQKLSLAERKRVLSKYAKSIRINQNSLILRIAFGFGDILKQLFYNKPPNTHQDCPRTTAYSIVDPWGNQFPCEFLYDFQYGNSLNDGASIWEGTARNELREEIKNGSFPVCQSCNRLGQYRYPPAFLRKIKYNVQKFFNKDVYLN